jgi:acetyl-CoA carboxylase biotin carboxyl carrier protein
MDIKEIREILKLLERYEVSDFTLQRGDNRIRVRMGDTVKELGGTRPIVVQEREPAPVPATQQTTVSSAEPALEESLTVGEKQFLVTSPIVGTFYRAPSPESPPYMEVGSPVSKGTVLCIVEAMKIMNEIECEVSGKVSAILAENAQPVEYGQPLFIIDLT